MKTFSLWLSLASALAAHLGYAAPFEQAQSVDSLVTAGVLEELPPESTHQLRPGMSAAVAITAAAQAATAMPLNQTTCGAYEITAPDQPMFIAVTAVFAVPQVKSRPKFDWTLKPDVPPRMAVSAGIDGFDCPEMVRSGSYASVDQNGTGMYVPFVEFGGKIYAVKVAAVGPGDVVRVRLSMLSDAVVNIDWTNMNTSSAFNRSITTTGMCGKSVSWFVEDLVPFQAAPGDFFAAFEPVRFSVLEGERIDGNKIEFDPKTANFTSEHTLCKVDHEAPDLTVIST